KQNIINSSKAEKIRLETENTAILLTSSRRARLFARTLTLSLMTVLSVVLLAGAAGGSGLVKVDNSSPSILKTILALSIVVAVGWSWFSWISGRSLRSMTEQLEHKVTLTVFSWITGRSALPEAATLSESKPERH